MVCQKLLSHMDLINCMMNWHNFESAYGDTSTVQSADLDVCCSNSIACSSLPDAWSINSIS